MLHHFEIEHNVKRCLARLDQSLQRCRPGNQSFRASAPIRMRHGGFDIRLARINRNHLSAPRRAIGSETSPPPQPISSRRKPSKAVFFRLRAAKSKWRSAMSRMKRSRTGLNLWSGLNLPFGSHHSSAMAVNFATSSRVDAGANRCFSYPLSSVSAMQFRFPI